MDNTGPILKQFFFFNLVNNLPYLEHLKTKKSLEIHNPIADQRPSRLETKRYSTTGSGVDLGSEHNKVVFYSSG